MGVGDLVGGGVGGLKQITPVISIQGKLKEKSIYCLDFRIALTALEISISCCSILAFHFTKSFNISCQRGDSKLALH